MERGRLEVCPGGLLLGRPAEDDEAEGKDILRQPEEIPYCLDARLPGMDA